MAAGAESFLQTFIFSSQSVSHQWDLWQAVTYAFVHRPPYWLFLLELYMLVVFGREIEVYLGRKQFVQLYAGLLLAPPVLFVLAGLAGWPSIFSGSSTLHFGIFVAFTLLYPTAEILFTIQARWVALALLAINSLQCLALADYTTLAALAAESVAACLIVGYFQGRFSSSHPKETIRIKVRPNPREPRPAPIDDDLDSIDPILEKISRQGMNSLSARERERLQNASAKLLAKDSDS
jgi:membrane associated rhomboid family serine protease